MQFLELKDISERGMELVNPVSAEKIVKAGEVAGLHPGARVIDFGCGFGEVLRLWATQFDISGIGIDIRPKACERARKKMEDYELSERIEIVCQNAKEYAFEPQGFDLAACIGATFIWDGFQPTLQHLREAIRPQGSLVVGQAHWRTSSVPPVYAREQSWLQTEYELVQAVRMEGLEIIYAMHASQDDWDRYETENWHGLVQWIEEHPGHPDREQVIQYLHDSQDEYTRYGREYFDWALYVLRPAGARNFERH